jgi:hypothetical protein
LSEVWNWQKKRRGKGDHVVVGGDTEFSEGADAAQYPDDPEKKPDADHHKKEVAQVR